MGTLENLQYWDFKKNQLVNDFKSELSSKEISRLAIQLNGANFSVFYAAG